MDRRELSTALIASVAGAALLAEDHEAKAQTCDAPCWQPAGNVKNYGALGNSSDATMAINAAIAANNAVFFPAGNYMVTSPIVVSKSIKIYGEGHGSRIFSEGLEEDDPVLMIDGTPNDGHVLEFVEVSNLNLDSEDYRADLLVVKNTSNSAFRDISLSHSNEARFGVWITGDRCFTNIFDRVSAYKGVYYAGVVIHEYTGGGNLSFVGCSFGGAHGLLVGGTSLVTGLNLVSCTFEGHGVAGVYIGGSVHGLNMSGCRFEKIQGDADILIDPDSMYSASVFGIHIHGCFFNTDGDADYAIQFAGSGGPVRGFDISGNYAEFYSQGFVRLNGDGNSGTISGNRLSNVSTIVNGVRPGVLVYNNENQSGVLGPTWNPALTTQSYTVTNGSTDRGLNVTADNLSMVANVLGTLVADLKTIGLIA